MKANRFHTIPNLHLPTFTVADLEALLQAAKDFQLDRMRLTPANQLAVSGINDDDLVSLCDALARFMPPLPDNGKAVILNCPGCQDCHHGLYDTGRLAEKIRHLALPHPLPGKVKIAIAGCPRSCTMPRVRDVGLFPSQGGWNLSFGGNGGSRPRIGDIIATNLSEGKALNLVKSCLTIYYRYAQPNWRTSRFMEFFGIERFLKKIAENEFN